jgi:hypothetical protein
MLPIHNFCVKLWMSLKGILYATEGHKSTVQLLRHLKGST